MEKRLCFLLVVALLALYALPVRASELSGEAEMFSSYDFSTGDLDYGTRVDLDYTTSLGDSNYFFQAGLLLKYQDENNFRPLRVKEAYLQGIQAPWEEVDFKLGFLQLTWGASDVMSPVDSINPRPFSASLSEEALEDKIPIPALDAEWYFSDFWSLEFLYQVDFIPNFVPASVEEQLFAGGLLSQFSGLNPEALTLSIEKEYPEVGFTSPIWAIRARGMVSDIDVAFSFYHGYFLSGYPRSTDIVISADSSSTVQSVWGFPERSILGLEFQGELFALEGSTFRGDLALVFPEKWEHQIAVHYPDGSVETFTDTTFTSPYLKASLGVDYTTESDWYFSINYLLGNPFEEGKDVSSYLYFHTDYTTEDGKWKPMLTSVLSLQDGSMVNMLGATYKPRDNWEVSFSFSLSSGASNSKLGSLSDGVFLSVDYSF
ncbi:hypothetical protein QBE54_02485 [Thermatribacter velox]|uniref:Alginate export domain-containing protein n=1 Tax=Thermatribacter velox TaxID=3039681 RepID=A0ABZ2YC89_9BACT